MTPRLLVGSLVASLLTACGGSNNNLDTSQVRTAINIRVVNLYSGGAGAAGPSVDIYRAQSASLGAAREATPVVSALAYATASSVFHPLVKSDLLEFFDQGTTTRTGTYAGFMQDTQSWKDGDKITLFVNDAENASGGSGFQPAFETRYETDTTNTPAVDPAKAIVFIQDAWRGAHTSTLGGFYLGSGGTCLTSSSSSGTDPTPVESGTHTFAFAPGSITVALFPTSSSGPPDCTGTPLAGPITIAAAAAGSRTWLSLYGTSATDLRLLTLPFQ
ncbi:MAG: hypothetical protein QM723_01855 [Myxococcaceae bacterium]